VPIGPPGLPPYLSLLGAFYSLSGLTGHCRIPIIPVDDQALCCGNFCRETPNVLDLFSTLRCFSKVGFSWPNWSSLPGGVCRSRTFFVSISFPPPLFLVLFHSVRGSVRPCVCPLLPGPAPGFLDISPLFFRRLLFFLSFNSSFF